MIHGSLDTWVGAIPPTRDRGVSCPFPASSRRRDRFPPTDTKPSARLVARGAPPQGILRKPNTSPSGVKGKVPKIRHLYLLPAAQGSGQRDLVGELQVGAHRHPAGDPRHLGPAFRL